MTARMGWVIALACQLGVCAAALGQDTLTEGGVQYRVTQRTERRPVADVTYQERRSTVYREEIASETRDIQRIVQVPVTEYVWEPYWVNRWNPFATPYIARFPRTTPLLGPTAKQLRLRMSSTRGGLEVTWNAPP